MPHDEDLGPRPDPQAEPGEPNPGGVDAVPDGDGVDTEEASPHPLSRDAHPDANPSSGEVPLAMKEGEDTSTEATRNDDAGAEVPPEQESPA